MLSKVFFMALCLVAGVVSQNNSTVSLDYLDEPVVFWSSGVGEVGAGNGAFISPDGQLLVVVGADTSIRGIDPKTGEELWVKTDAAIAAGAVTNGGAFFSKYSNNPYVIYAVTYDAIVDSATSTVFAYDYSGDLLFQTEEMEGVVAGTPVTTADGSSIMVTHNVGGDTGYFSVFDYPVSTGPAVASFTYTAKSQGNSTPFSPVGYFHSPAEGNFPEGAGNTNDLFMFCDAMPADSTTPGGGQLYAFQKPIISSFDTNATKLVVTLVGNGTQFESPNAPVFSNKGYLMYISTMQSVLRYWAGSGLPRDQFDRGSKGSQGFERGTPRYAAALAPPSVDYDPIEPRVYGPSAAAEIFGCDYDLTNCITTPTAAPLTNKILVSPDNQYIYYAVNGALNQARGTDLSSVWNITVGTGTAKILGEIAQSPNGRFVYVADSAGTLSAYQVTANSTVKTPAPTAGPTVAVEGASDAPSITPSQAPMEMPTPVAPRPPVSAPTSSSVMNSIPSYISLISASIMFAVVF